MKIIQNIIIFCKLTPKRSGIVTKLRFLKVFLSTVLVLMICVSLSSCIGQKSLILSNDNITLSVGGTYTLTTNLKDENISWSSSNEGVAKVDSGRISALSKGDAIITAMLSDGQKATCNVVVEEIEINSVSVEPTSMTLKPNETANLTAKVYPAKASADGLDWSSSNANVASVDSNGLVMANSSGNAIIKCTAPNGKSASCTVKVKSTGKKKVTSATVPKEPQKGKVYYCRASEYATLRATPSRGGKELAKIETDESIIVLDTLEEFHYCSYQGKRGYVLINYFSEDPEAPINFDDN